MIGAKIGAFIGGRIGSAIGADRYGSTDVTLVSIAVTPGTPLIGTTATQQMTATGTYSDASEDDITDQVTWGSATEATATIDSDGLATAVASGTTVITASLDGVDGTTTLCVAPQDATSGKFCPLTQNGWDAVFTKAGVPTKTLGFSWGLQDASGNPASTVGAQSLTAYGSPTYQAAVAGWDRDGITLDAAAAEGVGLAAGTGPNAGSTSVLWLGYMRLTSSTGATRTFLSGGNAGTNHVRLQIVQTNGRLRVACATVNTDSTANHADSVVRPYVLVYNRTAGAVAGYSDLEALTGTYSAAVTDNTKGCPANATLPGVPGDYLYLVAFSGAHAEWDAATVEAVLVALGWTIPW